MYYALKAISRMVRLFPLNALYVFSGFIVKIVFVFWREKRRNVYSNYSRILEVKNGGPATKREIKAVMKRNFENYGKFIAEFLYITKLIESRRIPEVRGGGVKALTDALKPGKGLIICTLHFSNWDMAGITIAARLKGRAEVWAVADDLGGGYNRFIQESRNVYGMNIVLPKRNLKDAYRCLERNGVISILVDRPVSRADGGGVEVLFFGKTVHMGSLAARLAVRSGAAVMLGCIFREGNRFYGDPGLVIQYRLTQDYDENVRIVAQAIMNEAEKVIMRHPEDWYMFRRMFPD